jgi:hypothetical protein
MNKNTTKKLIGQPIFSQILNLIPKHIIREKAKAKKADRYYKEFTTEKHLISLLFGILSKCNTLRELCEGMLACEGKLNHFGLIKTPSRSTISDANNRRTNEVFESIYFSMVDYYRSVLSDSRKIMLSIKKLLIIDSTTIKLFSDILQGVGRNPKHQGKKKGGVKVHMLIDAVENIASMVCITAAKVHDSTFLKILRLSEGSFVVFDRAYNHYKRFAEWTDAKIYFVTRMKTNAVYEVIKVVKEASSVLGSGVKKEEIISMIYKEKKEEKKLQLRRITYIDEQRREYVFITNNFDITAEEVALIYKNRWQIELIFKKLKQNFPLKYFYGETENAIKTQIWCTLIANLLITVLKQKSKTEKAFSNIVAIVRMHLLSYIDVFDFLKDTFKAWSKNKIVENYQLDFLL